MATSSTAGVRRNWTSETTAQTPHEMPVVRTATFCTWARAAPFEAHKTATTATILLMPLPISKPDRDPSHDHDRVHRQADRQHRLRPALAKGGGTSFEQPELVRHRAESNS